MVDPLAQAPDRPVNGPANVRAWKAGGLEALYWIRTIVGWTALIAGLYFFLGWALAFVPRDTNWPAPTRIEDEDRTIEIMVHTNGAHTAIVMPKVTPEKDWTRDFPAADVADPAQPYTHVAISWGEREVFLNTPTWGDLSPLTVLRVVFIGGDTLFHVEHYVRPAPSQTLRPVRITPERYLALVEEIEQYVPGIRQGATRRTYPGYYAHDVFYDALGTYTPVRTCNQWTNDRLGDVGLPAGFWTPFAPGVMHWYEAD